MTETGVNEQVLDNEPVTEQPTAEEIDSSKPLRMTSNELKELQSLVKEVTNTFKNMEAMTKACFDSAGVNFETINIIESFIKHPREIDDSQESNTRRVTKFPLEDHAIRGFTCDPPVSSDAYIKSEAYVYDEDIQQVLGDVYVEGDDEKNLKTFNDIFQVAAQYITIRDELIGIQNEYREEIQKQYNYMTSPEFAKEMEARLKEMEKRYEEETDEHAKAELGKAITAIKSMNSMDYIFKRLNGPDSKKEVDSISKSFFETYGSKYIMERYEKKAAKIGLGGNIYLNCFGIETKFLDEKYHPFNNLFLFSMIRLIAYVDVNNKDDVMYAKNTMRMMLRLMNHAFPSQEAENAFINVIKSYLEHFMPKRDLFAKENTSYIKYLESINTPDTACMPYERMDSEANDSYWITSVIDDTGNTVVITELKSSDGIKLFANAQPIIRPSEVPEDCRSRLAVLSDGSKCVTIPIDTAKVVDSIKKARKGDLNGVPEIPARPEDAVCVGSINTKGLWTTTDDFSWHDSVRDNVKVYVQFEHGYVWIDDYFVVNINTVDAKTNMHTDVWLATNKSIIRTNISASAIITLITSETTDEPNS